MSANWANQTMWTGDNLPILRGMNSDSVDLIYADPPFNSKANYAAPIGSKAAGAAFKDTWGLSDVDAEWINLIEAKHPRVYRVLLAAMTDGDKSYLAYMAARLLECQRVLKPTGSIYLHCDPTMSHYLKLLMDAVFGKGNFRNEITWKRRHGFSSAVHKSNRFGVCTDTVLFFAASSAAPFRPQYNRDHPAYQAYVEKSFRLVDNDGRRYQATSLTNPAYRPNLIYDYKGYPAPRNGWMITREKMEQWDREGRIHFPANPTGRLRRKSFADELKGLPIQNIWDDIQQIGSHSSERIGYPTQKPLALLERVIQASSTEGDVVLDPFCGCATACVAAEKLGRQWAGIDISPKAAELVERRMRDELGLFYQGAHRTDIPKRTDLGKLPAPHTHRNALYGEQGGDCAGCGEHFRIQNLEVDHIIARANGGTDHVGNLQLLCGNCNRVKGDRGMAYSARQAGALEEGRHEHRHTGQAQAGPPHHADYRADSRHAGKPRASDGAPPLQSRTGADHRGRPPGGGVTTYIIPLFFVACAPTSTSTASTCTTAP
ncbi:MAG: DNA methyltransferase [Chloroflexi bacterium]|nr:DNA methyltransferase [Chloroflexota bacterium]